MSKQASNSKHKCIYYNVLVGDELVGLVHDSDTLLKGYKVRFTVGTSPWMRHHGRITLYSTTKKGYII